jgi:hypothetical protein
MQTVNLGHVPHLAFVRLVQSDPHEAVSEFPHPTQRSGRSEVAAEPLTVEVDTAIH